MAHPYASQAKSGSASKMKGITGKKSGGAVYSGEAPAKPKFASGGKVENFKVGGAVSAPSFARGGRSKGKGKGNTNIKIMVVAPGGKEKEGPEGLPPPMLPPRPPMAPPPGMGPPGAGGPPGMPPPMKRGGKVPMKSGAGSGPGREEKIKAYGLPAIKKAT